jgi:hypothetical protein
MAETENLTEVRETLIFGALREASYYVAINSGRPASSKQFVDPDLVRMVVVDEAITRWFRLTDVSSESASKILRDIERIGVEPLLRDRGYLA